MRARWAERTTWGCLLGGLTALAMAAPAAAGPLPPPVGSGDGGVRMKHLGRFDEPVYATTAPGRAGRDLVFVVDLPDTQKAFATSAALSKLTGIAFTTAPAVTIEEFDKLMG